MFPCQLSIQIRLTTTTLFSENIFLLRAKIYRNAQNWVLIVKEFIWHIFFSIIHFKNLFSSKQMRKNNEILIFFSLFLYLGISRSYATRCNPVSCTIIGIYTKCTDYTIASMCSSVFQWITWTKSTTAERKRLTTSI